MRVLWHTELRVLPFSSDGMSPWCAQGFSVLVLVQWLPHIEQRVENNTAKPPV